MKIVYSEAHRLHFPQGEIYGGELVTPFERPSRMEYILRELDQRGLRERIAPGPLDMRLLRRVHDRGYLDFLATAWAAWSAAGYRGEILPTVFPQRGLRQRRPLHIDGQVGYYAHSAETCIAAGTWAAARAAAAVANTGQRLLGAGERAAFALCRPPGHHAHRDLYGGYCFLNNAALAAEGLRGAGCARVAVLDIDFHHGNGTQNIFYARDDVLFCSLHGDPRHAYPHFLGYKDETGTGAGEGANVNYPLLPGTRWAEWSRALDSACRRIKAHGVDALVVSLGVDTFKDDPISFFKLESEDYLACGARIARLGLPTLFVMEGGYAVEAIGVNTVNVLVGFLGA